MTNRFNRVRMAVALALVGAWLCLQGAVQAHPELARTGWKEINGPWRLTFNAGQKQDNTYTGTWSGKLHHDRKDHPNGVYVLTMESKTRGKLTLFDNSRELCSGTIHFEGRHHLKFGTAEYRRE